MGLLPRVAGAVPPGLTQPMSPGRPAGALPLGLVRRPAMWPTAGMAPRQPGPQRQARLFDANDAPPAPLPAKIRGLYEALNLAVTRDTLPAYTRHELKPAPKILAAGRHSVLYAVTLPRPDGSEIDAVFKPLVNDERSWVARQLGIPRDDPQIAMRNLATQAYARRLLDVDVVAETRLAVLPVGPHARLAGPRLGLLMEKAGGVHAVKAPADLLDRADVRAEVMRLQWLDHLTGQGDRHAANYFIDLRDGRAKVTGIDNDLCFGRLRDPEAARRTGDDERDGFHGTAMPPVVDVEMARRITTLAPERIREALADKLAPEEVEAAVARHAGVKRHVEELQGQGRVIAPADWSRAWVTRLLNRDNSYVGRELAGAGGR